MKLPASYTKLYVFGEPINQSALGFVCGKHNIYVGHITVMDKNSAIVEIRFDKEADITLLMEDKDYVVKRIFKMMDMKKENEETMKDGVPVYIGFILNTGANLLGLLKDKKKTLYISSKNETMKKLFVENIMKIRDEKKFDTILQPDADINLVVKRVRGKDKTYIVTWVEGEGFSNKKTV